MRKSGRKQLKYVLAAENWLRKDISPQILRIGRLAKMIEQQVQSLQLGPTLTDSRCRSTHEVVGRPNTVW